MTNSTIIIDDIAYSVNEEDKTASVVDFINDAEEIFIPRSITKESQEYIIISLSLFKNRAHLKTIKFAEDSEIRFFCEHQFESTKIESITIPPHVKQIPPFAFASCFHLKNIIIPSNSELQTIEKRAFIDSAIEIIDEIPSTFVEFKQGWCEYTRFLSQIKISQENHRFKTYEDKFLLRKSSPEKENYDTLIFSSRNIQKATIPSFIEYLESYSFEMCSQLQEVEFAEDSKLQSIGSHCFSFTKIEGIKIPRHVKKICERTFCACEQLQTIDFCENCELETIEKDAFMISELSSLTIPSSVTDLEDEWCHNCFSLKKITVDSNNKKYSVHDDKLLIGKSSLESERYNVLLFCFRDVIKVTIPSFIEVVCPFAFEGCQNLQEVEIPDDSKLRTIENYGFTMSSVVELNIPKSLQRIGKKAFSSSGIQRLNIPENSELHEIEEGAFEITSLEELTIPANLTELKEGWCNKTRNLKRIKMMSNNPRYILYNGKIILGKSSLENDVYDVLVFCARNVEGKVTVPQSVKVIQKSAFCMCKNLRFVEFPENSQLQAIEEYAFENTAIQSISFPPHLSKIGPGLFLSSGSVQLIELDDNSELLNMSDYLLGFEQNVNIMIPVRFRNQFKYDDK